jgi:hypothetical protein
MAFNRARTFNRGEEIAGQSRACAGARRGRRAATHSVLMSGQHRSSFSINTLPTNPVAPVTKTDLQDARNVTVLAAVSECRTSRQGDHYSGCMTRGWGGVGLSVHSTTHAHTCSPRKNNTPHTSTTRHEVFNRSTTTHTPRERAARITHAHTS